MINEEDQIIASQ